MRMTKNFFLTLVAILCLGGMLTAQEIVKVGKASYFADLPAGRSGPANGGTPRVLDGRETTAKLPGSPAERRPVPTNQFWSSIIHPRGGFGAGGGIATYMPPLSFQAGPDGFAIGSKAQWSTGTEYHFSHQTTLKVNVEGATANTVKASDWYENGATANLVDGSDKTILAMSFQKSSPAFVFSEMPTDKAVTVSVTGAMSGEKEAPNAFGFVVEGRPYGVFLDKGKLTKTGNGFSATAEAGAYLTVALLPKETKECFDEACNIFGTAPAKPVSSWVYDPAKNVVVFTYADPNKKKTAFTMMPHQWKFLDAKALEELNKISGTYFCARGNVKVFFAEEVKFEMPVRGLLPSLGPMEGQDADKLKAAFLAEYNNINLAGANDAYWYGKGLQNVISAARIADELGLIEQRDAMVQKVKTGLEGWFTATPGKTQRVFAYSPKWGTLLAYNPSFGSEDTMNDHHFHYGYFISAATFVAQYDPEWAKEENWGGMVNMLIRDAGNYDKKDPMFPWMRCSDFWEGHGWANGFANTAKGNDNESSSEAQLFNSSVFMWGAVTGNDKIRDHGAYLYTMETSAIEQYWWNIDSEVYPDNYKYCAVGMVWGSGTAHATWFSGASHCIHGINFLPINTCSTYMGRHPEYVNKNYAEIAAEDGGSVKGWTDVVYSYWILGGSEEAQKETAAWIERGHPNSENGLSKTFTKYWIWSLANYGTVDLSVTADTPTYQVFVKDVAGKKQRTYVAWNPGKAAKTVKFSDGTTLEVPAGKTVKTVK